MERESEIREEKAVLVQKVAMEVRGYMRMFRAGISAEDSRQFWTVSAGSESDFRSTVRSQLSNFSDSVTVWHTKSHRMGVCKTRNLTAEVVC